MGELTYPELADKDWVYLEYVMQGKTTAEIASGVGCSRRTVERALKRHGIEARGPGLPTDALLLRDGNWLRRVYVEDHLTRSEIGHIVGRSSSAVGAALRRHHIDWRPSSRRQNRKLTDREWLQDEYVEKRRSAADIAREVSCTGGTVVAWLRRHRIPVRTSGESRRNPDFQLADYAREFIEGELLGDGSISARSEWSAVYGHASKYREYVEWLSGQMEGFGLEQCGSIRKTTGGTYGAMAFQYATRAYPALMHLRKKWYPNGKKRVPRDLKLAPITVRQWFIGDGGRNGRAFDIATHGFPRDDATFLARSLTELGLNTKITRAGGLFVSALSADDFLGYIGPCPVECYQYKWERP